jgi:hypothetical protein
MSSLNTTEPRGNETEEFHVGFAGSGNHILPNTDAANEVTSVKFGEMRKYLITAPGVLK